MSDILFKYAVADAFELPLIDAGATDYESSPLTFATGDIKLTKDGAALANTDATDTTHLGEGLYTQVVNSADDTCKRGVFKFVDQTATKEWEDDSQRFWTYGHGSAQYTFGA